MSYDGSVIIGIDGDSRDFRKELDGLGRLASTAGKAVVAGFSAAATTLAGIGAAAAKVGTEYETSLAKVSTIADTSVKSLGTLGGEVIALSNKTGTAVTELNEALYSAISAGADTAHATELVDVAVKSARGGFTDTETAVDGLTSALNAYGMATTDAEGLANKFLITQNLGKTTFGQIASSIGTVAPTAKAANVSVNDLLASVASLTANGIGTSEAMTGMKAALSNVIKPTSDAAKMAKSLGLDFSAAALQSKGWAGFLEDIKTKTGGSTEKMSALFGSVEALNTVLTLTSDQGAALMNKTLREMQTNTTALDDAYNAMSDTAEVSMSKIGNSLKNIGIEVYDSFKEPMADALRDIDKETDNLYKTMSAPKVKASIKTLADSVAKLMKSGTDLAVQAIPKLVNGFAFLVDHGKQVAKMLGTAAVAFGTFKAAAVLDKVSQSFKAASLAVSAYTAVQGTATTALTVGQTAVGVMTGKLSLAAVAQGALNAAMALAPFTMVAAAAVGMAGAVALVKQSGEEARAEIEGLISQSQELREELDEQRQANEQLASTRSESVADVNAQIGATRSYVSELETYLDADGKVREGHEMRADYLANEINKLIPGAVEALGDEEGARYKIRDSIDAEILAKQKSMLLDAMQPEYEAAIKGRLDAEKKLTVALEQQGQAKGKLDDLRRTYDELTDASERLGNSVNDAEVVNVWNGTAEGLNVTSRDVAAALADIENQMSEWNGLLANDLTPTTREAQAQVDGFNNTLRQINDIQAAQAFDEVNTAAAGLSGTITQFTGDNQQALAEAVKETQITYDRMVAFAAQGWDAMSEEQRNAQLAMLQEAKANLDRQVKAASDGGYNIAKATGEGAARGAYVLPQEIQSMVDKSKANLEAGGVAVIGSGENFAKGFDQGVAKNIDTILTTVNQIDTQATSELDKSIEAQSPSRKTRKSGLYFSQGMALGIGDGESGVINASIRVAQSGIKAAKDTLQIKSPSRVMREQVGRMLSMGMALGIEDGEPAVKSAITMLSHMALENAKEAGGSFKEIGSAYISDLTYGVEQGRDKSIRAMEAAVKADVDAYKKKVDSETDALVKAKQKQMDKVGKVQKEALQREIDQIKSDASDKKKAYEDAGKKVTDGYSSALKDGYDEALNIVKTRVNEITSEFESAQSDILKRQQDMQKKLSGFGDLFTIDDSGYLSLGNIDKNIEALNRYDEALSTLADRGVSDEFMQQVTALGVEEGTKFAEKLAKLPPDAFEKYMGAWQEQQDLAKTVSEKFYADQLETLKTDFAEKLDAELENVPTLLTGLGQDSIQGMIDGMYSKDGALSLAAAQIVRNAISAMRMEADINSPSKKTRDLIGKPLAEGIGAGFDAEMANVYRQISGALDNEVTKMSADVQVQANRQAAMDSSRREVRTHFQREIIEKTPIVRFEGELAPLGRILLPVIEVAKKRRGDNMVKGEA